MNLEQALELTKSARVADTQSEFSIAAQVLADEVLRMQKEIEMAPHKKMLLPNGNEVTVAMVIVHIEELLDGIKG